MTLVDGKMEGSLNFKRDTLLIVSNNTDLRFTFASKTNCDHSQNGCSS